MQMEQLLARVGVDAVGVDVHRGAQAGMHDPAVVAFEVVLAVGLPIHGAVAVLRREVMLLLQRVAGRHVGDRAEPFEQRRAAGSQAQEDEAAPLLGLQRIEAPGLGVEPQIAAEIGRLLQPAVEAIAPTMVGADDELAATPRRLRQELRAPVPAHVVEGADAAVVVADGEDREPGERSGHVVAGRCQPRRPGEQHPVAGEDLLPLAFEQDRVAVVAGRQRPFEARHQPAAVCGMGRTIVSSCSSSTISC